MPDPDRLLVISHSVSANIDREEIAQALPDAQRAAGWDHVEIAPLRATRGMFHTIDWPLAQAEQERLFAERLESPIMERRRIAYLGFVPIPLALHLGYRVQRGIKV